MRIPLKELIKSKGYMVKHFADKYKIDHPSFSRALALESILEEIRKELEECTQ